MSNKFGTSDDWADGDVLYSADQLDTFDLIRFHRTFYVGATVTGVAVHSGTAYSMTDTNGTPYYTADSGVTWTASGGTHSLESNSFFRGCKDSAAKAFMVEFDNYETAYSSDSGANFNAAGAATFGTAIHDMSFPTTNLIVVFGDDAAGTDHIILSVNQGTGWANATTTADASVFCGDMFNGTTGYCVTSAGKIFKTADSAVNWTDTTHTISGTPHEGMGMLALTATTCIITNNLGQIEYYDSSGNSTRVGVNSGAFIECGGIVQTNDGDIFVVFGNNTSGALILMMSEDTGSTWREARVGNNSALSHNETNKCGLAESSNNNLLISTAKQAIINYKGK